MAKKTENNGNKNSQNKKKTRSKMSNVAYDHTQDNQFAAEFDLGPNVTKTIHFSVDSPICENLTYDEVEDKAYFEAEKLYPIKSFPEMTLINLKVLCTENGQLYPVYSESDKESIRKAKNDKKLDRFLVLPDATYRLTPESELWMKMIENGIINENEKFDYDKMHEILMQASKISNKLK